MLEMMSVSDDDDDDDGDGDDDVLNRILKAEATP